MKPYLLKQLFFAGEYFFKAEYVRFNVDVTILRLKTDLTARPLFV